MTCAKKVVVCLLKSARGEFVAGVNECAKPQSVCPRAPGEGYEKCRTICEQTGHAEVNAINAAKLAGIDLAGATATISHSYVCDHCQSALIDAGVTTWYCLEAL